MLVSIVGFGRLVELYSPNFPMKYFWALLLLLFFFAFVVVERLGALERRFDYFAAARL